MAAKDKLIDEKGHTFADAKAQHPLLDTGAKPASEETPKGGGDVMVPAQSPAEVEAQILNRAGHPDDTHDLDDQLEEAAEREAESEGTVDRTSAPDPDPE